MIHEFEYGVLESRPLRSRFFAFLINIRTISCDEASFFAVFATPSRPLRLQNTLLLNLHLL